MTAPSRTSRRHPERSRIMIHLAMILLLARQRGRGRGCLSVDAIGHHSNSNKDRPVNTNSLNSLASRRQQQQQSQRQQSQSRHGGNHPGGRNGGGGGSSPFSRNSVALSDSFPCEDVNGNVNVNPPSLPSSSSSAAVENNDSSNHFLNANADIDTARIDLNNSNTATTAATSHSSLNDDARNSHSDFPSSFIFRSRGGASSPLEDDDLDDMVDRLIAGLDIDIDEDIDDDIDIDEDDTEEETEEEETAENNTQSAIDDSLEEEEEEEELNILVGVSSSKAKLSNANDVHGDEEQDKESSADSSITINVEKDDPKHANHNQGKKKSAIGSTKGVAPKLTASATVTSTTTTIKSPPTAITRPPTTPLITHHTTPTNAYYRFLLRRGPKFHIIASLSLLLTQWTYIYLPLLYQPIASLLLKCHIYDPHQLLQMDRANREHTSVHDRRKQAMMDGDASASTKLKNKLVSDSKYSAFLSTTSTKRTGGKKSVRKAMQKREDEEAAFKLQRLATMGINNNEDASSIVSSSSSSSPVTDVRYQYLSVAFRKRHGLGKEYRVEKPRQFMGEKVGGNNSNNGRITIGGGSGDSMMLLDDGDGIDGIDGMMQLGNELVLSDAEEEEDSREDSSTGVISPTKKLSLTKVPKKQQQQQRRVRRKKINDWVVQAFVIRRQQHQHHQRQQRQQQQQQQPRSTASTSILGPSVKKNNTTNTATTNNEIPSSLWNAVLGGSSSSSSQEAESAILGAAWESRRAEQLIWQKGRGAEGSGSKTIQGKDGSRSGSGSGSGKDQIGHDGSLRFDGTGAGDGSSSTTASSYSGSKMFQSVMSRVGTNGRILGAYPMDAPPIDECANEQGVLNYARRYGYGDWSKQDVEYDFGGDEGGGDDGDDDSWGGDLDLFLENDNNDGEESDVGVSSTVVSESSKGGRRKRRSSTRSTSRRKKKASASSHRIPLEFSGGDDGNVNVSFGSGKRRVTFEFGINSSTSSKKRIRQRVNRSRPTLPLTSTMSMERNPNYIQSRLQKRNPVLFSSDTRIRAPMQILNDAKRKPRRDDD